MENLLVEVGVGVVEEVVVMGHQDRVKRSQSHMDLVKHQLLVSVLIKLRR
jgi:hypothetical protein